MRTAQDMSTHFDIFNEAAKPFSDQGESDSYLAGARDRFGVAHLSYWFLGKSQHMPDRLTWLATYDKNYMNTYMQQTTPLGDPAFEVCFNRLLPLDWAEFHDANDTVLAMQERAAQYGIGRQGISFPIRDPGFGEAMFSVNFQCSDEEWKKEVRTELVGTFHLFAHFFHLRMRDILLKRPESPSYDLSPREREVMSWAAEGKTAWETARLLNVSERAVRLYTENAISKLNAKTKTQAVAIAIRNAVIH
jgi:DNA-binding CsgD family transcriptional regulator